MAQVTTNTEINTINILQEATSVNGTDLFLLQRGSQTFKLQKSNLTFPVGNIEQIGDKKVLGNISGGPSVPYEIDLLDFDDIESERDDALVTEKRLTKKVNEIISNSEPPFRVFTGSTSNNSITHGENSIPNIFFCHVDGKDIGNFSRDNGTDGGLAYAGLKATASSISIVDRDITDINGTRYFTAIWFS
jgi:hypothetical protein